MASAVILTIILIFRGNHKNGFNAEKTQAGPAAAGEKELSDRLNTPKSIMCFGVGEGGMEAGVLIDCSA